MKKKLYWITGNEHEGCGVFIFAQTRRKAIELHKKSSYEKDDSLTYNDAVETRNDLIRSGKVDHKLFKNNTIVEDYEGLKAGLYGWLINADCPNCKAEDTTVHHDGHDFYCDYCEG